MRRRRFPSLVLVLLAGLVAVPVAEARIQGVKGRRLQLFSSLAPHVRGTLILEEPSVVSGRDKRPVGDLAFRWYAHEFLETRLRALPWHVEVWYDEFGPVEEIDVQGPALVLSTVVTYESGFGGERLALEAFFRDHATGDVVARYTGFGRGWVRGTWKGARDDLQEITRVLVDELAPELGVVPPRHVGGYEPDPYRRRARTPVVYETVADADDVPRMELHGEPPVQLDAPVAPRFRDVPDEVHRQHFEPSSRVRPEPGGELRGAGQLPQESLQAAPWAPPPPSSPSAQRRRDADRRDAPRGLARDREPPPPGAVVPDEEPAERMPPSAPSPAPDMRLTRLPPPAPADTETVFTQFGSDVYHLDPRCPRLEARTPRRLSVEMAAEEGLRPCPRCVRGAP